MATKLELERKAQQILKLHGVAVGPIDPVQLANQIGLKVYNAKFPREGVHGLLALRGGEGQIYVEVNDTPNRKRFTVAHEIAHYLLHFRDQDVEHVDDADSFRTVADPTSEWTPERRREWEANYFAAALLMPERAVREAVARKLSLSTLADYFQVSDRAMAIRLADLGLETDG